MPKTPFEKYVGNVQRPILNMIPTSDLLRMGQHYKKSESNLEERQSILIELFSRYKDEEDILYQIAYLQHADMDLFKTTLLEKPFVQHLKNAMQSPFSTTEHKLAIVSAWNGTPVNNEDVIDSLKAKKTKLQNQVQDEALVTEMINSFPALTGEKRLRRLKLIFTLFLESPETNDHVGDLLLQMTDTDVQELSDYLLQKLGAGEDTPDTLKILALISPRTDIVDDVKALVPPLLDRLTRHYREQDLAKALIDLLPVLEYSYEQPFIDALLRKLDGNETSKIDGLTWLSQLLPKASDPDIQKIINRLFDEFEVGDMRLGIVSKAIDIITTLIPRMDNSDVQKYIHAILEKADHPQSSIKADAMEAIAKILPMLTKTSDIEQFIQPILVGLNSNSADVRSQALNATTSILSKVDKPIIQAFIQPVLTMSTKNILEFHEAALKTTVALLPNLEQNERNTIITKMLTDMCRSSQAAKWHHNYANFLSHFVINNQTPEEFKLALNNADGSNKAIVNLQKLMEQWQMIISKEDAHHYKTRVNEMNTSVLPEIEEAPIKPLGSP